MIPILFEHNATTFTNHGIADLVESIKAVAAMNADGDYELELLYPVSGEWFNELKINRIVLAKSCHYRDPQAFRIYKIEKTIRGEAKVYAEHISYDLAWIPVRPFSGTSGKDALTKMKNNAILSCPFIFSSNLTETKEIKFDEPVSMRAALLSGDNSIKGICGGDVFFNNYSVALSAVGGEDRGVVIEYGIDLVDMTQEENNSELITGVLPYYRKSDGTSILGSVQYATGTFDRHRVECVDLSSYFPDSVPTAAQLNAKAKEWIKAEEIGIPEINLTVSYAWLNQDVRLHDAIKVKFPKMGIETSAKVIRYTYDILAERPIEIEVGKARPSFLFSLDDASRLKKGLLPPDRIGAKSITSSKYGNSSIPSSAYSPGSVINWAIGDGAVSYGKTDIPTQGTLDQVGVNKADIEAIKYLFANVITVNMLNVNGIMRYQDKYIRLDSSYQVMWSFNP